MIKFNRVLDGVKIPVEFKVYVNNYINESIKLMEKQGYIDEFICSDKNILNILKQKNIIWTAYYNDYDMLIPTQYFSNKPSNNKHGEPIYILHDQVFTKNGFKVVTPY